MFIKKHYQENGCKILLRYPDTFLRYIFSVKITHTKWQPDGKHIFRPMFIRNIFIILMKGIHVCEVCRFPRGTLCIVLNAIRITENEQCYNSNVNIRIKETVSTICAPF